MLERLVPPALQQPQQCCRVGLKLLQWMARDAGDDAGDEPRRSAQLDDGDERAVLLQRDK
jgi:hypothetical protein